MTLALQAVGDEAVAARRTAIARAPVRARSSEQGGVVRDRDVLRSVPTQAVGVVTCRDGRRTRRVADGNGDGEGLRPKPPAGASRGHAVADMYCIMYSR